MKNKRIVYLHTLFSIRGGKKKKERKRKEKKKQKSRVAAFEMYGYLLTSLFSI